jgi:hypothetical protein
MPVLQAQQPGKQYNGITAATVLQQLYLETI